MLTGTRISVINRIPQVSRNNAASKLSQIINILTTDSNKIDFWAQLFLFPKSCLRVRSLKGQRWSLSTLLNHQIAAETLSELQSRDRTPCVAWKTSSVSVPMECLVPRVSSKPEEGDFTAWCSQIGLLYRGLC
jgi:hypothetical protein